MNHQKSQISKIAMIAIFAITSINLAGCANLRKAAGNEKIIPDEFRVVTKAPLVIPPEFNLRPPRPGEARPLELRADLQARNAVFGVQMGEEASIGERELIAQMGASNADPRIREIIDEEAGNISHKSNSFADKIFNFNKKPNDAATPLNSEEEAATQKAEQESIAKSTGGKPANIQQYKPRGFKLPGL